MILISSLIFNAELLIVEDEESEAELCAKALSACSYGKRVCFLKNGQELLDYLNCVGKYKERSVANNYLIKLVLLDIHMPVLSGLEALKVVKSNDTLKHVPIVMLANTQTPEDITQSYHLGANSFIFKSIDFKQFKADIDVLLDYWFIYNQTVSCI